MVTFRKNFHGTECNFYSTSEFLIGGHQVERDDFLRFIDTIKIKNELEHLRNPSRMNLLRSLTTLRLYHISLNEHKLHGFENIQTKIETVRLNACTIDDNSVGEFLASCSKLKCLRLSHVNFKSEMAKVSLFQRTYTMLNHFKLTNNERKAPELTSFLKRNPSIKHLQVAANALREILLENFTIQLDYLDIANLRADDVKNVLNRLKKLHANKFFKKILGVNSECTR